MQALVVDDSKAMRTILKRIVTECGYNEVFDAGDGLEAFELVRAGLHPTLVLADCNMPEMNGIEFVAALRSLPGYSDVTVVMVTTETSLERVEMALEAGADEYVMKPFTKDVLLSKLALVGAVVV